MRLKRWQGQTWVPFEYHPIDFELYPQNNGKILRGNKSGKSKRNFILEKFYVWIEGGAKLISKGNPNLFQ